MYKHTELFKDLVKRAAKWARGTAVFIVKPSSIYFYKSEKPARGFDVMSGGVYNNAF